MKTHIFSSGEEIFKKNLKTLSEGVFLAKHLEYDDVNENTVFMAVGELGDKPAVISFKVRKEELGELKFRHSVNIIMQSDIFLSEWEKYELNYL